MSKKKFINKTDKDIPIRHTYFDNVIRTNWDWIKPGETVEIEESIGLAKGLTLHSKEKLGEKTEDEKKSENEKIIKEKEAFMKQLIGLPKIEKKTAEDIMVKYTKEEIIEKCKKNEKLGFRDDVEKVLYEFYGDNQ